MDVKTTFRNRELDKEVYRIQLDGFVVKGHQDKVYRLHKSLYGLKEEPKQ